MISRKKRDYFIFWAIFTLIVGLLLMFSAICRAGEIPDDYAVSCIMGEARGEGYEGMLMLAGALRNRGTTHGVYGCRAKFAEPSWVWDLARKAWNESAHTDTSKGADHWGSLLVDKKWIQKMIKSGFIETVRYKKHVYFKED